MRTLSYLFSILITFLCISFNGYSQELATELNTGYKVGDYEVFVFTEGSGDAETGLLIDAPADITAKYAPNGTFSIATNVVLVKGKGKVWLIDTGYGWKIFEQMENLGVECQDVDQILLTHMHGDHVGGMLLVWGDLTHALAIQMPHPEISITYDVDPDMARETRLKVLEYLADKDITVIGMHVPVPQPGKIVKDEISGGYRFLSKLK